MPLDNSNGIMAQAMAPQPTVPPPAASSTPAASPAAPAASPATQAPDASNVVPDDYFKTIGPAIAQTITGIQQTEDEPLPNAPPPLFMPPAPTPTQYNPMHAWGSTAMFLAGIGSLLTRTPLTTALNAASGVMNASRANNDADNTANFNAWKAQTANALNLQKFELTQYTNAIKAHSDNLNDQVASLTALATSLKDAPVLAAYQTGGLPAVIDLLGKRAKAASSLADTSGSLQTYAQEQDAWQQYLQAHPKPTDPNKIPAWTDQAHAASQQIFKTSIQDQNDNTPNYADKILPSGYSMNQYTEMAREAMAAGKDPDFGSGKLADAQRTDYQHAKLGLEFPNGPTGNLVLPAKPGSDATSTDVSDLAALKKSNPDLYATALGIANYDTPPPSTYSIGTQKGDELMAAVDAIAKAQGTVYDASSYGVKVKARNAFAGSVQGNRVTSFNVFVSHLDTLQRLSTALQNGDIPAFNRLSNEYQRQTGRPAITNFDAAKRIVADEIVRAVTGAAGALGDRETAESQLNNANSPQQLAGVINTYKQLAAGQLAGLQLQYEANTGLNDFDRFLSPEAKNLVANATPSQSVPASGQAPTSGTTLHYDAQGNLVP